MRYMYIIPQQDKYVYPNPGENIRRKAVPLSTYKFKVHPQLEAVKSIPKNAVPRRMWATPDKLVELCGNIVNHIPLPDAFKWTNVDVIKWLQKLGFPEYRNTFFQNHINGRTLLILDASALQAMNVKDFDHIKTITKAIRDLYQVELFLFNRSISLPPYFPMTHYKLYHVQTGPKYDLSRPTDLWKKMKILRNPPPNETHWSILEKWLPDYQKERIGYAPRRKLYKVKKAPPEKVSKPKLPCGCFPPCECEWTEKDTILPWKLAFLKKYLPIEEDDLCACVLGSKFGELECEEMGEEFAISEETKPLEACSCIVPPCECGWNKMYYVIPSVLNILKIKLPRRYSHSIKRNLTRRDVG